jgi:hypothetical protein
MAGSQSLDIETRDSQHSDGQHHEGDDRLD